MPVSTSLSASSLNDHSGAKTGLASLTSGVTVLLTLLFLAPLFSNLPKPVLAALIIEAVVMGMMNVPEMRRLARVKRFDFWIAVAAIVGTLVFGVLAGVMIGIGLSLIWLVSVATRPDIPALGREPGTQVFRELDEHPGDEVFPGVAVIRLDGGLFFATADALEDRLREVIHSTPGLTGIVLDCEGINFVDSQGAAKLAEIVNLTRRVRHQPASRPVEARCSGDLGQGRRHPARRSRHGPRQHLQSRPGRAGRGREGARRHVDVRSRGRGGSGRVAPAERGAAQACRATGSPPGGEGP